MKMLLRSLIFICFHLAICSASSIIIWNVNENEAPKVDFLISKASKETPLVVFVYNKFTLTEFGKHASVYDKKNEGGSLKALKSVIDSSKGYTVSNDQFDDLLSSNFITVYDSSKIQNLKESSVIVVVLKSWEELDTVPKEILGRLDNDNYVAVLTNSVETPKDVQKREAKVSNVNIYENATFINTSNCLFYARRMSFIVRNFTVLNKPSYFSYILPPFNDSDPKTTKSKCHNYSENFRIELNNPISSKSGPYGTQLDKLLIEFNLKLNRAMGWWSLDTIHVAASGNMIQTTGSTETKGGYIERTFNGSAVEGYIEGPMLFSYACGGQKPMMFYFPVADKTDSPKLQYGVSFDDLMVQPFKNKMRNKIGQFTDDVYDCVPFISIAVWMFLVCAAILLVIVFCGLAMISSLKTMDRFDDPKGKPLVVNVKE